MSTLTTTREPAGRAVFDGWRHGVAILPALLVLAFLTMFNPLVLGVAFLAMLVGTAMLRPMSFARLAGLAAGLVTGLAIAFAGVAAMLANADF
jgi:hypothetical protein